MHESGHDLREPVLLEAYNTEEKAREHSLVLLAMGLPHLLLDGDGRWRLVTEAAFAQEARRQLHLYKEETASGQSVQKEQLPERRNSFPLIAVLALAVFHIVVHGQGQTRAWLDAGCAWAEKIQNGEWWRLATALTLHLDNLHLVSNLAFGGILMTGVLRRLGPGPGWFLVLASGILGNLITALTRKPEFRAAGASTAVFGAVGVLAGVQAVAIRPGTRMRGWAAPAGALALLGLFGSSPGSDLTGHLFGLLSGLVLGLAAGFPLRRRKPGFGPVSHVVAALLALGIVACWIVASGSMLVANR